MSALSDRFATWDAAYVLGALSPVERREYEEHLAGCPACQAAVSELAGLPGLLAQVPPEDGALLAAAPGAEVLDDGPPPDLLAPNAGAAGPALAAGPHAGRGSGRSGAGPWRHRVRRGAAALRRPSRSGWRSGGPRRPG